MLDAHRPVERVDISADNSVGWQELRDPWVGGRIQRLASSIQHRVALRPLQSGRVLRLAIALFAVLALPGVGLAQEIEPRVYANIPVGMNFLAVGYSYSSGNVFMDPSSPTQGVSLPLASGRTFQAGPDFGVVALAYQVAWGGK